MYFKESDDIAVACKGCEWDVEFVKEAGQVTRDAQVWKWSYEVDVLP